MATTCAPTAYADDVFTWSKEQAAGQALEELGQYPYDPTRRA